MSVSESSVVVSSVAGGRAAGVLSALAMAGALVAPCAASAQAPPAWGGLEPGPYAVGYRVELVYDHTRTYRSPTDLRGRPTEARTSRPVQISMWYPAGRSDADAPGVMDSTAASGAAVRFGEYLRARGTELGRDGGVAARTAYALREFRGGPLRPHFPDGVPDSAFDRILDQPTAARRDASAAPGTHPVVVYPGVGAPGHSVLFEYLASHGYVVASFPLLGTSPAWWGRGENSPAFFEATADDIGFTLARLRSFPSADVDRAAVIGMFASAGLLYQMRTMRLRALGAIESSFPDELRAVTGFDPVRVRIPILDLRSTGRTTGRIVDSLRYAMRRIVRFDSVSHRQLYQFRRIADPGRAPEHRAYEVMARWTRAFLDAQLRGERDTAERFAAAPSAAGPLPGSVTVETIRAEPPVPSEAEFLTLVREDVDAALRVYREAERRAPGRRIFDEAPMRTVSLFLWRDEGADAAVKALELLVDAYPESAEAQRRLAAAYRATGRSAAEPSAGAPTDAEERCEPAHRARLCEELLEADRAFAAATAERGADGWASYFLENGAMLQPGAEIAGREQVRRVMEAAFADSAYRLTWEPDRAVVADGGDMGYTIGRYETRRDGPDGVELVHGRYVSLWRRDAAGEWKVRLDIGLPDPE